MSDFKDVWSSTVGKAITIMLGILIAISGFIANTTLGNSSILSEQKGWMSAQDEKVTALSALALNQQTEIGELKTRVAVLETKVGSLEDEKGHSGKHH